MRVPKPGKHGRDHCPGGEDEIPCLGGAWIRRRFTDTVGTISCPDANDIPILFNDGGDENSAEVQGSDNWRDYWELSNEGVTKYLAKGLYLNSAKLRWVSAAGFDTWICMDDGPQNAENLAYFKPLGELAADNWCATWPHRQKANSTAQMRVAQDSAGAQDVATFYWEIWFLGSYTGPDPDTVNTIDPVE